ncbi:TolC family outer membrane protein [Methylophilus sp. QUAN]|uniref:TolC family outer membrane protein n=1 Tax=Methylophilus sp. QUAN TaxID=2781020 RepID=UPI0018906304|nr:TolC family outer membrane protein [Methylophilus sp. QUAN]MBF4992468.1 TolC family outer membrane protein [Methylophilus sp. QUAN]
MTFSRPAHWILLLSSLWLGPWAAAAPQSLFDVYLQAKQNDPQLAAAGHGNLAAQELIEQAKAGYRPNVALSASTTANHTDLKYNTANVPLPAGVNRFEGYAAKVEARQPIYRKENLERIDLSKVQVSVTDKQLHLTQQQLMLRTTQAYFDVLQAQDRIELLAAQKQAIQQQLQQAKASFETGITTVTDLHEAQARYDLIVAQEIAAENEQAVAQHSLQAIIGNPPQTLAKVRDDLQITPALKPMQDWQTVTAASNLNIQIQQAQIDISDRNISIAQSGHYPTLDAVASYTDSHYNGSQNRFGTDLQNAVIGVELNVPIYLGGAVDSRIRQASYNKQKAQDDLENVHRQTMLETQRAYLGLSSSIAQIKALEQALQSSQSQLDATKLGYEVGIRTSVDLLNARQQHFSAKRDLLQARYNYLVSIIRLKTASGIINEADLQDIDQQLTKR